MEVIMANRVRTLMLHHVVNVSVAIIWAFFSYRSMQQIVNVPELSLEAVPYLAWFLRNSSITLLFLIRKVAKTSSRQVHEWLVAFVGTFIGFLYQPNTSSLIPSHHLVAIYVLMIIATALSVSAILSLGRSFGLVPANRGVRTKGLYSIVRHPIYACYILFDIAFITIRFSWFNLFIFCTSCLALYLRGLYEERFLRTDPAYRDYMDRIRYMFFPKVI
jgi:protein-S-isoprenylcysteine O-methyltransferase Ste14